ncbi:unnamed protein product [Adineta ricciae]|uniref:Uncharacterized protein n=1 Tax=Adineta ricciae TaxID=249248 RepID=A0A815A410_ADIRI|nr:unnamed protein product [Adineta ricciae]CAF1251528.1 unnamed protein product [Adineta ricciae]
MFIIQGKTKPFQVFLLVPFWLIFVTCQLNMYNVERKDFESHSLAYDCLNHYIYRKKLAYQNLYDIIVDIIPFCIRPSNDSSNDASDTSVHPLARRLSFTEISLLGINSQQVVSWSIPMITAERYQAYLNASKTESSDEYFYNCTQPWFGIRCQYSFGSQFIGMSFNEIVEVIFTEKQPFSESSNTLMPISMTCYVLIECHRDGLKWCLDWREICNGVLDCFDEGIDEEGCFVLEMNACADDEYRCHNGMCIAEDLWNDGEGEAYCADRSDEMPGVSYMKMCYQDASFRCEEHSCRADDGSFSCGDGECVRRYEYCYSGRHRLLIESMLKQGDLADECWMAMTCLTRIVQEINGTSCNHWLMTDYVNMSLTKCPWFFQFPAVAVYSNHVRFFYEDVHSRNDSNMYFLPDYICYDAILCKCGSFEKVHDNLTCIMGSNSDMEWDRNMENPWSTLIWWVEQKFRSCLVSKNFNSSEMAFINYSTLYICETSSKIISTSHVKDNIYDCAEMDDEFSENGCYPGDRYRVKCDTTDICWPPIYQAKAYKSSYVQSLGNIPFQSFCDGIRHDFYHNFNKERHSEEDECNLNHLCNNIYARCDGFWACADGRDEFNCGQTICPLNEHACVSPHNYTVFCLPHNRVNDSVDDCLGATDEQEECRFKWNSNQEMSYLRCLNDTMCLKSSDLCDNIKHCPLHNDDEAFCRHLPFTFTCNQNKSNHRTQIEHILCGINEHDSHRFRFFTLVTSSTYPALISSDLIDPINYIQPQEQHLIVKKNTKNNSWSHYCNRGLMITKFTNNGIQSKCLCPPSYYGDLCQYQNQRISLKLQLSSTNRQEIYGIVVILMENNRIIEFNQFQYIAKDSCTMKFNQYLLYQRRPKNLSSNYNIRIDVVEKNSMIYIGHWYYSVPFLFLPVNHMALSLNLSSIIMEKERKQCLSECLDKQECVPYVNDRDKSFCRWKTPVEQYGCSNESIFIGMKDNNRSICMCSLVAYGPTCLLSSKCSINPCKNHGQCIRDEWDIFHQNYSCICSNKYYGLNCEYRKWQLDVEFDNKMKIPSYIIAYFYTISNQSQPIKTIVLRKLTLFQHIVTFHISIAFHLVFIEIQHRFYLAYLQHQSYMHVLTNLNPEQECHSIEKYVNSKVLELHRYERINEFHRICLTHWDVKCFVDEIYMCLCTNDHHANCFEFHDGKLQPYPYQRFQCSSTDKYCLNEGRCYQDHPKCPSTKICLCRDCFFGDQCQFYAKGLGSTLDEILGYEFQYGKSFSSQSFSIHVSAFLTMFIFVGGMMSSIFALMTFTQRKPREVGCGLYLWTSSLTSLITIILFTVKFLLLLISYQNVPNLRVILITNCRCIEILLKLFLFTDSWLNACVAIERTYSIHRGLYFDQFKSRKAAKWVIGFILILNTGALIPQFIFLHVFQDEIEERSWCVVRYTNWIQIYTMAMLFIHYFVPLCIQICSTISIILITTRQKRAAQSDRSYWSHLKKKIRKYKQLLISPLIIICLTLPHLIISIILDCQKSSRLFWFYLIGYFLSFIPAASVFLIFVLPSPLYRAQFRQCIFHLKQQMSR